MQITVNGESKDVPEGTTLEGLVRLLALAPERLAVEFNYEVLRRAEWAATTLSEGDRVEIVHFVGGGTERDLKAEESERIVFRCSALASLKSPV